MNPPQVYMCSPSWTLLPPPSPYHPSDSFETPWTVACQSSLSMGFPRQEYWSGLPFPSPEDLPNPEIEPKFPALAGRFFTAEPPGKPLKTIVVHSLSRVQLFMTWWTAAHQASLSFTISQSLLRLMSIKSVMPSNHLILCLPILLLPSIFPIIRVFSKESALCIRWPNYWSFCFSISPSSEYSRFISFRIDWFDLLKVQGTFKSLLQHHSPKASILRRSAFFMVQLSHPYMTTGKIITLTMQTFVTA